MNYYNPQKLLNMKDLDGEDPSIYIVTTNRSAGKTTSFLKKSLQDFNKNGAKLVVIYRFTYELSSCPDIFKDVLNLYPNLGEKMTAIPHARGLFYEMFLDDVSFGYAVSLSNPDALKKYSPIFADVQHMLFDEFQSETGRYVTKEVEKFQSIYLTIARGGGQQSRHVKVYMLGNMVSIMNPYFIKFGIHKRIKDNTNFMRGNGWVAEFGFNESASNAIKNNSFFKAFQDEDYMSYSTEKVYLHDADIFIEKPKGRAKYICTIVHDGTQYGVREYFDEGVVYVSHKPDTSCKQIIAFKASDHNQNTIMLGHYSYLWKNIKDAFNNGYLRFDDMKAKSAIFDILSVDLYK
jgi:hypothetical protein